MVTRPAATVPAFGVAARSPATRNARQSEGLRAALMNPRSPQSRLRAALRRPPRSPRFPRSPREREIWGSLFAAVRVAIFANDRLGALYALRSTLYALRSTLCGSRLRRRRCDGCSADPILHFALLERAEGGGDWVSPYRAQRVATRRTTGSVRFLRSGGALGRRPNQVFSARLHPKA